MLFETIKKIHERPLPDRRRIAFWWAFSITCFIALVWLVTLLLSSPDQTAPSNAPVSPFESVWGGVSEGFNSFKKFLPEDAPK